METIEVNQKVANYIIGKNQVVVECNKKVSTIPFPNIDYKYIEFYSVEKNDEGIYLSDVYEMDNLRNIHMFLMEVVEKSSIPYKSLSDEMKYKINEIANEASYNIYMYGKNVSKSTVIFISLEILFDLLDNLVA